MYLYNALLLWFSLRIVHYFYRRKRMLTVSVHVIRSSHVARHRRPLLQVSFSVLPACDVLRRPRVFNINGHYYTETTKLKHTYYKLVSAERPPGRRAINHF